MQCFLLFRQPKAFNGWKKLNSKGQAYRRDIRAAYSRYYGTPTALPGDLYGVVYYFYNKDTGTDADNISKPVWDCLTDFLYQDDKQVKLRVAACYDLTKNQLADLDVTGLPSDILPELLEALDQEPYVIYIECGTFNKNMMRFNLE